MSSLELAQSLHGLVAELDAAADSLLREEFGVTHSQLGFLMPLHRQESMDVSTLAAMNRVSVAAVSKRVGWFVERDLIRAEHPEGDAKRVLLTLTARGSRLTDDASRRLAERLEELLSDWPERKRSALHDLVGDLAATLHDNRDATGRRNA